eukprot:TRINITY_DN86973_c0_g1_i1.p1 TRINITY_DN86973_c0_g1~~TRINITY_DN86973_c0_g1_i1.p1  ORF type:complete len:100 (-),score=13.85 TRINITY_DN86973_c0_g1_i1:30-329(-)
MWHASRASLISQVRVRAARPLRRTFAVASKAAPTAAKAATLIPVAGSLLAVGTIGGSDLYPSMRFKCCRKCHIYDLRVHRCMSCGRPTTWQDEDPAEFD